MARPKKEEVVVDAQAPHVLLAYFKHGGSFAAFSQEFTSLERAKAALEAIRQDRRIQASIHHLSVVPK